ncbi:MAG TPA: hypothetical protein VGQ61_02995, partial [Candidatus Angelobacter sp.]|nr:hypothetical protein [Candidatus Angelobacter sp.]
KLRRWMWVSMLVPLALFAYLLFMASKELTKLHGLEDQVEKKQLTIDDLDKQIKAKQSALTAYTSQRSGDAPTIAYYRKDPALIGALQQLGFKVEENVEQANLALTGKEPDELVYGCAVSEEDIRVVASALIKAGIHIRRISPAKKKPDRLLIQVVARPGFDPSQPDVVPATWKKKTPDCQAR